MTKRLGSYSHEYSERDLALYALGLGCGVADLPFVYECHPDFAALPTFAVIPAHPVAMFVPLEGYIPSYDRVRGMRQGARGAGRITGARPPEENLSLAALLGGERPACQGVGATHGRRSAVQSFAPLRSV